MLSTFFCEYLSKSFSVKANRPDISGERNISGSFGMSSIRAAVKTIGSFILHFLDTNCQGLDLQRGVKSDENVSDSTVFMVMVQYCQIYQNELLLWNKWTFPNNAKHTQGRPY